MRIAIYTRKSVFKEHSVSIETQIDLCKSYFGSDENEYEVFIDEGFSGGNTNRPSFLNMMDLVRLGKFDVVAIYKIDRISRNIRDFFKIYDELENNNVKLVSVTERFDTTVPTGKMLMLMTSGFADMERGNIQQRVKDNMFKLAKNGCFTGGFVPFGCTTEKKEGKSYIKIVDVDIIQLMFTKYLEFQSLYATQKYLLDNKIKTVTTRSSLRSILRNPVYCKSSAAVSKYLESNFVELVGEENGKGYMTYGKTKGYPTLIVGKHKACIESDLFLKVNMLMDKNKEDTSKRKSKVYWLSNVLYCPFCGSKYRIVNSSSNSYYVCSHRINMAPNGMLRDKEKEKCMNNKYVNAKMLEDKIEKVVTELESLDQLKQFNVNNSNVEDKINILQAQIKKNEANINSLTDKLCMATDNVANILLKKIDTIDKENIDLKNKIDELRIEDLKRISSDDLGKRNECIKKFANCKDLEKKRIYISTIFDKIVYNPYLDKVEFIF